MEWTTEYHGRSQKEEVMDNRTGEIITEEEAVKRAPFAKLMKIQPTSWQMSRKPPRVGRNEPCPCGSGKKFKRCCLVTAGGV